MRREDQERILTEVESRVVAEKVEGAAAGGVPLVEVLADTVYHEKRRLKLETDPKIKKADGPFIREIEHKLGRAGDRELQGLLRGIVGHYATEICGNFDDRVYQVATKILPPAVGLLLGAVSPKRLMHGLSSTLRADDNLVIQGEVDHLRRLHEIGTVILTPTHVSNLDSPLLGLAIYKMGLPPFIYGAGLNLFSNPLMGFFMHNLGAYTVDRKKRDPLYKEVLKHYATLTLEMGYDNLFFPGGTRSRSGAVERHLKLGLLGCGLNAYVENLGRGVPNPKVFIVPATLSYQLVLEAETLVDDFLREVGRSRYVITDDEFSQPRRILDFVSKLFSMDSKIFLTISRGLDPFGNAVDDDGESHDPRGRPIDIARYVHVGGKPAHLPQRDAEYTRELGERIGESYMKDNVVQSTNVLARVVFSLLRKHNPGVGLVRLIRVGARRDDLELREVYQETDRLLGELRGLAGRGGIRLGPAIESAEAEDVVTDGLKHFAIYHQTPAAVRRGDRIFPQDRMLLFYYQNRLEGYRLDRSLGTLPVLSADHRTLGVAA